MEQPITSLKGVGDAVASKLQKLSIASVDDMIHYIPRKYQDFSEIIPIEGLSPGLVTVKANIHQVKGRYARRGLHITEASASDETDSVRIVWFNQPYRADSIKKDSEYYIAGEFGLRYGRLSILNPHIELVSDFPVSAARIIPIYRETKGVTSKQLRKIAKEAVPFMRTLDESLPEWILEKYGLIALAEAYENMHFPANAAALDQARARLGFQEVFELIMASLLVKKEVASETAQPIAFDQKVAQQFVSQLPFALTDGQRKVAWQIYSNLAREVPMNRLIEGDVGSGKTVVAAMAAVMTANKGLQTAFMAPTELLARQHAEVLYKLLQPMGLEGQVALLVGGMTKQEKQRVHEAIQSGTAKIIIGTHALIQDAVVMHDLALIIIDEQHRFGVEQRKKLMKKAKKMPHVLSLTATPIPRSLALTLYGELDISILNEKPAKRKEVITNIASPNSRKQLYAKIEVELANKHQMFVVCPLITDSEQNDRSVEKVYKEIKKRFSGYSVGMLHGKMSAEDKNEVMQQFAAHQLDILVATTVIEVGVDVPNATVMLIESADRFGLAQLHQLRGRVGRGEDQGYCYLMMSDSETPSKRMRALESSTDGFKLAELDLELRGPGAIYGTLQHGALDLRIARLSDHKLIAEAREAAEEFIRKQENLLHYPQLHNRIKHLQKVTNLN